MAVETLWCLVRHTVVERVMDDEGKVVGVLCPEYQPASSSCRLKGGVLDDRALAELVERVPDHPLEHPAARCLLL